jgi:hypothetical protein
MEIVWKFEFLENFHNMEIDKSIEIATSNLFLYYFHTISTLWKRSGFSSGGLKKRY